MDMAYEILQTLLQTFCDSIKKTLSHLSPSLWKTYCVFGFPPPPSDLVSLQACVINIHPNTHAWSPARYVQPITRSWVGRLCPVPRLWEHRRTSQMLWSGVRPMSRHGYIQLQRYAANASLWNGAGMHQKSECVPKKKRKKVEFMITYRERKQQKKPTNCENASYLKNNKHWNPTKQKNVTP